MTDLSVEGMALRILEAQNFYLFPVGTQFDGTLNLKGVKHEVRARVRHLGPSSVGAQFESLSTEASRALHGFLDPAALGKELKPIPASENSTLWYHGPSGTDLLLKRSADGQYHRMTVYILGSYVQWSEGPPESLITGQVRSAEENDESRGVLRFETMLLDADQSIDAGKLEVAKTLILSSNLAEDFKKWCVRKLASS